MKIFFTLAFILLLTFSNLFAFDGERRGFILGGGIGGGFLSNTVSASSFSLTESQGVFVTNFIINLRSGKYIHIPVAVYINRID